MMEKEESHGGKRGLKGTEDAPESEKSGELLPLRYAREPTLPGITLDMRAKIGQGGQLPGKAGPQGVEIRKRLPQRPQPHEILAMKIGNYEIEIIRGDCIVVQGKGQTTGKRLIPIAILEKGEDGNWRFKKGMAKALASFPPA